MFRPLRQMLISIENIYHCCVQKTASRWIQKIMMDRRVHNHSGLSVYDYESKIEDKDQRRDLDKRFINQPMPLKTIITPLYLDYSSYSRIPKPDRFRTFFVARDPRDIIVSWYFSARYSHSLSPIISNHRDKLSSMNLIDGLKYSIDWQHEYGVLKALSSWIAADGADPNIKVFKYEDLTGENQSESFASLFKHLLMPIPVKKVNKILADYRFEKLSNGRRAGEEDQKSHYRKGKPGDWKNYFDNDLSDYLNEKAPGLVAKLGY